jgi:hypothetical protein
MKTFLFSITSIAVAATSHAALQLNEIFLNPPGTDNTLEFIEIRSTTGGVESMAGLTLINLEGDGSGAGNIDFALNLGAFSTGTNGLFLWRDSTFVLNPAPNPATVVNAVDWPVNGAAFGGDLENGSQTFLIVSGYTGALNQDLDTNNDGVLDATPWAAVIDSLGFAENDAGANFGYGLVNFGPNGGFNADVLFRDGTTGVWQGTDVLQTNLGDPFTADPTPGRSGFAATGTEMVTPGSANVSVVPEPGVAALLAGIALLGFSRRRRAVV